MFLIGDALFSSLIFSLVDVWLSVMLTLVLEVKIRLLPLESNLSLRLAGEIRLLLVATPSPVVPYIFPACLNADCRLFGTSCSLSTMNEFEMSLMFSFDGIVGFGLTIGFLSSFSKFA